MANKLINYLPPYMQEYIEIQQITNAEQFYIDAEWADILRTKDNQFVLYTDEEGIGRWESMLKITPKATDTLQERQFRVLAKLQADTPYTIWKLREKLTMLCGADGFTIDLRPNDYYIDIRLAIGNESMMGDVERLLEEMLPANLTRSITILYNTHGMIRDARLRHEDLHAWNHSTIKREVLT